MLRKSFLGVLIALSALTVSNMKAGPVEALEADLVRSTAERLVINQEINRASRALDNHQANWVALIKVAIHHEQTHLPKVRLLIARARLMKNMPQGPVDHTEQIYNRVEANMNELIAVLAQHGISVN